MSFKLLTEAIHEARFDGQTKQSVKVLEKAIGKDKARRIVEGYQISPKDYKKWLGVVKGYAQSEGIRLSTKAAFVEVAHAVLENDPAPIDVSMQDAIAETLWAHFKAEQQHSKVQKITRAHEEEEQLSYALKQMRGGCEEEEEEDYQSDDFDDIDNDEEDFDDIGDDETDFGGSGFDDDLDDFEDDDFEDDDFEDDDFEDDDQFSDEGEFEDDDEFEIEDEEASSPFTYGQLVQYKKDNGTYKVEIPDGPGDNVGIMMGSRIRMIPSKDLIVPKADEDEEVNQFTSERPKISGLSDILSGANSQQHLKQLQNEIETTAANAWTKHHAKLPPNPHPRGSLAAKAWERGIKKAASEVWAPKPVVDPKLKPKPKKK
jgi:hypothetical protein